MVAIGLLHGDLKAEHYEDEAATEDASAAPSARAVVKALFPLWATVLVLLATRIPALGLRGLLTAAAPAWEVPLGSLGSFSISPALVLNLRGIFGTDTDWTHQLLYVPSLIPFVYPCPFSRPRVVGKRCGIGLGVRDSLLYEATRLAGERARRGEGLAPRCLRA